MARWRQAVELAMKDEDIERLMVISRSRTEAASRVERAQMLLTYRENPSFFAVGQRLGVHPQPVQRCVERAVAYGPAIDFYGYAGNNQLDISDANQTANSFGSTGPVTALGTLVSAAIELRDQGTYGYQAASAVGRQATTQAFG